MLTRLYTKFYLATRNDEGASAVEYGLLVAGIAVVVMGAVFLLGTTVSGEFTAVDTKISGTTTTP